ncbi:MAG: hypothetical protein ACJ763_04980 [Bdellovibrionia bacterium]
MKKSRNVTGALFVSLVFGLFAQSAYSAERQSFVIEKTGDVSNVQKLAEDECVMNKNNEVVESYESGYRSSVYSNWNGYERMVTQTTWKVVCRPMHFEGKMPPFVLAREYSRIKSTLGPEMRKEFVEAAAKSDDNCASQLLKTIKDFKQDPEISSALAELEKVMGTFSVAIGGYFDSESLEYISKHNSVNTLFILTPDYEKLGWFLPYSQKPDGSERTYADRDRISDSGCTVFKDDVLGLINRVIKEKKMLKESDVFSKLESVDSVIHSAPKLAERAIASTQVKKAEKSVTATFVDSPGLSSGLAQ